MTTAVVLDFSTGDNCMKERSYKQIVGAHIVSVYWLSYLNNVKYCGVFKQK